MAIDFPNSPSNGDIHTVSGKRWEWDGEKWTAYGASLAPDVLKVDVANNRVGINDTTPSYSLDVTGTTRVTGVITASGGVVGNVTGNASGSSGSTTGNAATATEATNITAVANNSTDETVYPTFVDGATGTQGIETDTGFTYNPSTGLLTAAAFSGPLTGNVTGNASGTALTVTQAAQTAITSVGSLTDLKIDTSTARGGYTNLALGAGGDNPQIEFYNANTSWSFSHYDNDRLQISSNVSGSWVEARGITIKDATGNVGIGDTSPSYRLEVAGTFHAVGDHDDNVLLENTGTGLGIIASHTGSGTPVPWDIREDSSTDHNSASYAPLYVSRLNVTADGAGSNLQFRTKKNDGTAQEVGGLGATIDTGLTASATVTGSLHFYTTDAGTQRSEKMTIKSTGNVGIGTTSPTHKLHAAGATFLLDGLLYLGDNAGSVSSVYNLYSNSSNLFLNCASGSAHYIRVNNATAMKVSAAGAAIGTGDGGPSAPLHVLGAANSGTYTTNGISNTAAYIKGNGDWPTALILDGEGSNDNQVRVRYLNAGTSKWQMNVGADIIWSSTSWTERLRIKGSNGNVGIANSSPHAAARLHVAGQNIFLQDMTAMGRTNSGAMAIFGHNVYASQSANDTVNCINANYYGQFMKMYHAYGITFHVSTAGHSANAVVQNSWTGVATTNTCDEAVQIQRGTQGGQLRIRGYGTREGGQLHLDGGSSHTGDFYIDRYDDDIRMLWGGVTRVSFTSAGNCYNTNGTWGQISDERLKMDIEPARDYLADLLNLEVVNFVKDKQFVPTRIPELDDDGNPTYKPVSVLDDDGNMTYDADGLPITTNGDAIYHQSPTEGAFEMLDEPSIKQLGLVAQQVEAHIPGLVSTDQYGVKAIKSSILVPMLLQAVQTLTARVTELESA